MRNAPDFDKRLQRFFHDVMIQNYNKSKTVKIPFFGGYLELEMSFDSGMIDLVSAKTSILGEVSKCDDFSLGYTDHVGMGRSTSAVLEKLSQDGKNAEANLFHSVMPQLNNNVQ